VPSHAGRALRVNLALWFDLIAIGQRYSRYHFGTLRTIARPGGAARVGRRAVIGGVVGVDAAGGSEDADVKIADGVVHDDALVLIEAVGGPAAGRSGTVTGDVIAHGAVGAVCRDCPSLPLPVAVRPETVLSLTVAPALLGPASIPTAGTLVAAVESPVSTTWLCSMTAP
jgi:hypothetical protein